MNYLFLNAHVTTHGNLIFASDQFADWIRHLSPACPADTVTHLFMQVAAVICHCAGSDAWHSLQRSISDGCSLCQQEHHQPWAGVCRQRPAGVVSGACPANGTLTLQDDFHNPLRDCSRYTVHQAQHLLIDPRQLAGAAIGWGCSRCKHDPWVPCCPVRRS